VRFGLLYLIIVLSACLGAGAGAHACAAGSDWAGALSRRHALDWQVYAARPGDWPPAGQWSAAGLLADPSPCPAAPLLALRAMLHAWSGDGAIVLLGEVHDNPHHHAARGFLIDALESARSALVLEHVRADQQGALDRFEREHAARPEAAAAAELFRLLAWERSGWPAQEMFLPLLARAHGPRRLPLLAGDPPRDAVRAVARQGLAALPAGEVSRLGLERPLEPALHEALLAELEASHCGLVPRAAFAAMAEAQRYRDAHQAAVLAQAAGRRGSAVLLAGNGHVRADRGVPHHLRRGPTGRRIVAVLLLEVEEGVSEPAAYMPRDPAGGPAADLILLTPRIARNDPCVEMREQFGRTR
jgi:uncharacterized iron-regulated protein